MEEDPRTEIPQNKSYFLTGMWNQWLQNVMQDARVGLTNSSYHINIVSEPDFIPAVVYTVAALQIVPGLVGNALLVCMTLRTGVRQFSYSIYLRYSSIINCLSLLISHAWSIMQMVAPFHSLVTNVTVCSVCILFAGIITSIPPWLSVVFSVDRYIAIVFPLKRKVYCTLRNARIVCGLVLLFVTILEIPSITNITRINFQGKVICASIENDQLVWTSAHAFITNIIPCLLLIFFNSHSLFAIKQGVHERLAMSRGNNPASTHGEETSRESQRQAEQQADIAKMTKSLLIIPVFAVITNAPHAIISTFILVSLRMVTVKLTDFDHFMTNVEVYARYLYFSSFAYSFYLLVATSGAYRKMARDM